MPDGMDMPESAFYGPIVALIVFCIFIVLIVALVRWLHRLRMAKLELKNGPLVALKEQLAKGEISTREFEKRRHQL